MNFSPLKALGRSLFLVALSYQTVVGGEKEAGKTVEGNKESGDYLHQSKAAADPAEWLQLRLNRRLNGRTGRTAHITHPEIIWSQFVGARETWIALKPSEQVDTIIEVPSEDYQSPRHNVLGRRWGIAGPFYDLDGTGELSYIEPILGWENGQFVTKWRHLIEAKISNRKTMHTYGPEPFGDIDGDGRLEVITSTFNEGNDQRWHVVAFDGITGDVKANLPGAFLQGSADLDADGADELLITRLPQGAMVPAYGTVQAVSIRSGEAEVRWQREGSGFEKRELTDFPLGASSPYPSDRIKLVVGPIAEGGCPVFFTRRLVNMATG